jgi:hypothetical protein
VVIHRSGSDLIERDPKATVYMAKGLSIDKFEEASNEKLENYRNAFFENDKDLEKYHKELKEALIV